MTMTKAQEPSFRHLVLESGLTVIAEIDPDVQSAATGFFVRTGSRDEEREIAGVSHFLEHMAFKGSRRAALEINRAFDDLGAEYNAFTNEEMTVFYGAVLSELAPRLQELLTELMRPALRLGDFDTEKQVILEEIALYRDNPAHVLMEEAGARYFHGHPLGNSVLGSQESIRELSLSSMRAYYQRRYQPGNLLLAASGNLDWSALVEGAHSLDGPSKQPQRNHPDFKPRPEIYTMQSDQASRVYLDFLAPGFDACDERRYAAAAVTQILGGGGSNRLYWPLVDSGLAEGIGAVHDEADGLGTFMVSVQTAPEHAEQVEAVLRAEMERLEQHGVSEEELEYAARKMATGLVFSAETPLSRLFHMGVGFLYTGQYQSPSALTRRLQRLSVREVNALLEERPFSRGSLFRMVPAG